ncbi:Cloroperoxidase [Mycena venus]|uniref:Cloroperoxidase n=1 Tax=Mycena venus TaxID=2733690 RepID=A0A8H6XKQ7_9AGAR|nr:Cloroperoxidase [Mycena venus]
MNTLANHGYIPRNGIASFEEITNAVVEAFNLEYTFAAFIAANNMLTRGNPFINKLSIGGESLLVPPLPGKIDGPVTGGIAKHGRFEGDASITRADAFIGDNVNFQDILYDMALLQLGKLGDDGPDGNNTVFNIETIVALKKLNIMTSQTTNPKFEFAARRMFAAYGEASFLLNAFVNGTTKQATLPIMSSFFRNQTFPPNWYRAASPVSIALTVETVGHILNGVPVQPGRNDAQGRYVPDPAPPPPFNSSFPCSAYYDQLANTPAVLAHTTGIFKRNVDLLAGAEFKFFSLASPPGCNQELMPFGSAGV